MIARLLIFEVDVAVVTVSVLSAGFYWTQGFYRHDGAVVYAASHGCDLYYFVCGTRVFLAVVLRECQ